MNNRDLAGDQLQVGLPAGTVGGQLITDGGVIQTRAHADNDGRTHCAKGYRRALHQHAHEYRCH